MRRNSPPTWSLVIALGALLLSGVAVGFAAERGEQLAFGVAMAKRGLWAEALFRFKKADEEDPGNPRILNNLAVSYEATGQFDEALELYKQAVKLDPSNADLKRNYARFVEFYQSYRPREEEEKAAKEAEESDSDDEAEGR